MTKTKWGNARIMGEPGENMGDDTGLVGR